MNPSNLRPERTSPEQPLTVSRGVALRRVVLAVGLTIALTAWLLRDRLQSRILERATLANDSPTADLVEGMIETSPNPNAAILSAWNTGKIVHRRVAIGEVKKIVVESHLLPAEFESLVLGAAFDPDLSAREVALSILRICKHPALEQLAAAQLRDCDPEIRLLGLDHLRRMSPGIGVPVVAPLLDDPDPFVAVKGLKLLEKWTGQNFGVKLTEIAPSVEGEESGLRDLREGALTKRKESVDRAKEWLARHRSEFGSSSIVASLATISTLRPAIAPDVQLRTLDGRRVSLAGFRGKAVLLNFWTTWSPAYMSGAQDLNVLQERLGNRLVVIGISLDNVPDPHGHVGHHEAGHHEDHAHDRPSLEQIRQRVASAVQERGIHYTVAIDEDFRVGGCFNAGDLPTTVIIDAQGIIRRRFTGRRPLPVLEMMIAEASQPWNASVSDVARSNGQGVSPQNPVTRTSVQ